MVVLLDLFFRNLFDPITRMLMMAEPVCVRPACPRPAHGTRRRGQRGWRGVALVRVFVQGEVLQIQIRRRHKSRTARPARVLICGHHDPRGGCPHDLRETSGHHDPCERVRLGETIPKGCCKDSLGDLVGLGWNTGGGTPVVGLITTQTTSEPNRREDFGSDAGRRKEPALVAN